MKLVLLIAVPLVALFTLFAWRISALLSPDAIAMAIGLAFGVLAGLPGAALVLVASRRADEENDLHYSALANTDRIRLSGPGVTPGVYRLETPDAHVMMIDGEVRR